MRQGAHCTSRGAGLAGCSAAQGAVAPGAAAVGHASGGRAKPPASGGNRAGRRGGAWCTLVVFGILVAGCSGGLPVEGPQPGAQFSGLDSVLQPRAARPAVPGQPVLVVAGAGAAQGLLGAEIPQRNARATLLPSGRNGPVTSWQTADAVSLALQAPGVLIATRGLGEDLHIAEAAASAAALARGAPAGTRRVHRSLGGDQQLAETVYRCDISVAGPETLRLGATTRRTLRLVERCEGGAAGSFVNSYWRDPLRPVIWQSEQWIGPDVGSIRLQLLAE